MHPQCIRKAFFILPVMCRFLCFFLFFIIIILRSQVHLNLSGELITFTVDTGCKFSYDIISE